MVEGEGGRSAKPSTIRTLSIPNPDDMKVISTRTFVPMYYPVLHFESDGDQKRYPWKSDFFLVLEVIETA